MLIIVVVSASTEAQFRGEQVVVDVGELVRPLVFVHRLVLLLPDMYRIVDPSVHSVAFSVDDYLSQPRHRLGSGQSHRWTPRSMTLDDLELYKFEFSDNFSGYRRFRTQQQLNV